MLIIWLHREATRVEAQPPAQPEIAMHHSLLRVKCVGGMEFRWRHRLPSDAENDTILGSTRM